MLSLLAPFEAPYLQRAWLELVLLAPLAGTLGTFVVLRRLAFTTHALAVGSFPGVVAALALGAAPFLGGLVGALALAAALALLVRGTDLDAPAATGLLLAGALGAGALIAAEVPDQAGRAPALLFGSLLGVGKDELWRTAAITLAAALGAAAAWRGWTSVAFDRAHAPALGIHPGRHDAILLALLALAVVAAAQAVGALLVTALLVAPAATARLFARRLGPLAAGAVVLALVEGTLGLWLSVQADVPAGAAVAAVASVAFGAALALRAVRRPARPLAAGVAALALLAGCGEDRAGGQGDDRLRVVATTPLVADWARAVGGRDVRVTALLPPGAEPHDHEPGPRDFEAVAEADLVVRSGAGLDDWVTAVVTDAAADARSVALAPQDRLRPPAASGAGAGRDPHFWHDPRLALLALDRLRAALAAAAPARAAAFDRRARAYARRVRSADADARRRLAAVPRRDRELVTDHDAYGYLAARFGLRVVGAVIPAGAEGEPGPRTFERLAAAARRADVRAVFAAPGDERGLAARLADEARARLVTGLYADGLGPPGSGADTYLRLLRYNAARLAEGLQR